MKKTLTWVILIALWCLMAFIIALPISYIFEGVLGMLNPPKAAVWFIVLVPIMLLRNFDVKGKIERAIDNNERRVKEGVSGLKEKRRIKKMKKMEEEIRMIREILREEEDNKKE